MLFRSKNTTYGTESSYGIAIQSFATNAYTELLLGASDAVDAGVIQTAGKNTSFTSKNLALQPNGGKVGIGTTSPAQTLHIDATGGGIVRVSRLGTGSGIMQMEADGTDGTLTTTNVMKFQTNSSERVRIDTSGNVGIGTTSPSYILHAYQSNSSLNAAKLSHVNGNAIILNASYNYYDAYNHIFRSLSGTTTYATIDNSGNFGLGVTPNSWYSTFRAVQFGASGSSIFGRSENNTAGMGSNYYINAAGSEVYVANGYASLYQQLNGYHYFKYAGNNT